MIRLTSGQYLSPVGARRECAAARLFETTYSLGMHLPRHSHQFAYLVLMIDGVLQETTRGRSYELASGWMVFNEAGESHQNEVLAARTRCLNVELAPDLLARLDREGVRARESVLYMHSGAGIRFISRLYAAAIDPGPELEVEGALVELLSHAWGCPDGAERRPKWIARVLELLHARFRETLTITQIADEAGVTHVHLCRGFRRAVGCTIGDYVRFLRTQWALGAVAADENPLAGVALQAGFADQSHMTRTFSRALGRTPGRLRTATRISRSRLPTRGAVHSS